MNNYKNLINDVAGPVYEGHCHIETAILEAKEECEMNYGISFDDVLKENNNKSVMNLKYDAVKQIKAWKKIK